jgi:hypothetical protein
VNELADLYDIFGCIFKFVGISTSKRYEYFYSKFTSISSHIKGVDDDNNGNINTNIDNNNDSSNKNNDNNNDNDNNNNNNNDNNKCGGEGSNNDTHMTENNTNNYHEIVGNVRVKKRKIDNTNVNNDNLNENKTDDDHNDQTVSYNDNDKKRKIDNSEFKNEVCALKRKFYESNLHFSDISTAILEEKGDTNSIVIESNVDDTSTLLTPTPLNKNCIINLINDDFERLRLWFINHISTVLDFDCVIVKKNILKVLTYILYIYVYTFVSKWI